MRKEIGFVKGIEEKLNHLMGLLSILMIVGTMLTLALGLAVLGNYMFGDGLMSVWLTVGLVTLALWAIVGFFMYLTSTEVEEKK